MHCFEMRPDMQLDYAVFQLNPTRTRCELHISAQGMTYKLAAGLLQPFVAHLRVAEEQVAGGGYLIRLEPPDPGCAGWFTKGTMERFVRFVSTPEVLERVSTIEMELIEIENTIRAQSGDASEDTQNVEELLSKLAHPFKRTGGMPSVPERLEKPAKESFEGAKVELEETSKQRLLRALEARRIMLEEELGVALARAIAAGFNVEHIGDLIEFAETFGARRLWGACSNLMSLCKTRQQSGMWQDDLKLSAAEVAQAEMAFGGNVMHPMGSRENSYLQSRGSKQHDLRRASLPSEGRSLMGDSGLEKLTRRGSLDELTGEFLQVAARMRSSGMMDSANVDWSNSWQAPIGGGSRPVSGEMQVGVGHLGSSNDLQDSESALKPARGHQIMAAWRGHPQTYPLHNVHQVMHGPMHSSLPASFGFPGLPVPGFSYPPYPYMGHAYADTNGWQIPSHVPLPYRPHSMLNSTVVPATIERGEAALPTSQKQEANQNRFTNKELTPSKQESASELSNMNELHREPSSSTQRSTNDQSEAHELHGETPTSIQRSASNLSIRNGLNEEPFASTEGPASSSFYDNKLHGELPNCTQRPASDPSVSRDSPRMSTQKQLPTKNEQEDESTNDPLHDGDSESFTERTRRLPIRSSSPSRRSASPLKKVQIGRSGSRRATRNVNYIAQNIPEKLEGENNDRESSESWSEDNDDRKKDEEPKEQPVRARVQDVIGLFERKKDGGDAKSKPLRKEIGRVQSNNSVLKRWTESGAIKKEANETKDSVVVDRIRKEASVASADDAENSSNQLNMLEKKEERVSLVREENAELAVASTVKSCFEQQASHEPPESPITWQNPSKPEADAGTNKPDGGDNDWPQREQSSKPDVVLESSEELAGESCDMRMDDDAQALASSIMDKIISGQEKTESLNDGQENEDGELGANPEAAHSKKVSARDAKAKAMQELLERRKAASGNRAGKPNPLAEAQLRAEKLRAYKAGLQKSKQEKDEEEKKRIEDLKSQRKERIAARGSPLGGSSAQSPSTRQAPQTPPLTVNRSSATLISHKLSSSSPHSPINVSASSLSPNVHKLKGGAGNKLPRTPTGPKENENAMSRSVPSLSELKKESPKATLAVRSSTGSQRLSQLKKNLKDADPNTSPKANGHSEEKRRSLPLATVRKGIPPAKDIKNESSPVVRKPTKGLMAANKQQRKPGSSPASVKPKPAMDSAEVASSLEQIDAANGAAADKQELGADSSEASLEIDGGGAEAGIDKQELGADSEASLEINGGGVEAGVDKQELGINITDTTLENNGSSLQEVAATQNDVGYAQIRASPSTDMENVGSAEDSSCLVYDELAMSSEPLLMEDSNKTEAPIMNMASHTDSVACSEDGEHREADGDKNTEDSYFAPVAHVSPIDENSTIFKDLDASREEPNVSTDELPSYLSVSTDKLPSSPPTEPYNPPRTLPSDSPLHAPKSLPRLHEAIQQAHSPEFIPGVGRQRKTRSDESGSLRSSKDHAKGLKRLLLLGRKSSRSSTQNAADWVSVSMVSEVNGDDAEDISSSNAKKLGIGSATSNTDNVTYRADKPRVESNSGNSSSKGSRSFFSLSTFRGKGEGKV